MRSLRAELNDLQRRQLRREHRVLSGPQGPEVLVDGKPAVNFCSNDYLGLAAHPQVVGALQKAAGVFGVGSGSAHLVSGYSDAHRALEGELAEFTGRPRALLFSSGYMANLGVISALLRHGDRVFQDRLNHASLLDAAVLSRARLRRYPHADSDAVSRWVAPAQGGDCMIVSDGVFSMDGDLAPLPKLAALARAHRAWLMVDDAHGLGVLGATGGGSLEHYGLDSREVPILVGTLGKAFGTFGAFVAGDTDLIEYLMQKARTYIYTTAPPPAVAEATRVSLAIARREVWRRTHLGELIARFRDAVKGFGLPLQESFTPIQPVIAGSAERALAWSRRLAREGILVTPIRPPTVPEGSARLRITLSAVHTDQHLARLLDGLRLLGEEERG